MSFYIIFYKNYSYSYVCSVENKKQTLFFQPELKPITI